MNNSKSLKVNLENPHTESEIKQALKSINKGYMKSYIKLSFFTLPFLIFHGYSYTKLEGNNVHEFWTYSSMFSLFLSFFFIVILIKAFFDKKDMYDASEIEENSKAYKKLIELKKVHFFISEYLDKVEKQNRSLKWFEYYFIRNKVEPNFMYNNSQTLG